MSSKQVMSKLADMGEFVKSPSSTVEASVARRLREALTGNGKPGPSRRAWPHTGGNNPYSPPRPDPNPRTPPPSMPRQRPRPPVPSDGPQPVIPGHPRPDDDSWVADVRRARANSRPRSSSRRPEQHRNPIVDVILNDGGTVRRSPDGSFPHQVHDWAQRWTEAWFEASEVAEWLAAGIAANAVDRAAELRRQGFTPQTWPGRRRHD